MFPFHRRQRDRDHGPSTQEADADAASASMPDATPTSATSPPYMRNRQLDEDAPGVCSFRVQHLPPMRMTQAVYRAIMEELTTREPEFGGMLLGPRDSDLVTHFIPDENGTASAASFTLDAAGLNRVLGEFRRCGLDAKGLVHSHPRGITRPSQGDLAYVRKSLSNPRNKDARDFLLPIVCDGHLYPYAICRESPDRVFYAELILV